MHTAATTGTIRNPVTGERIEIREHSEAVLRFDYALAPGGFSVGRVAHAHPRQVEQVRVRAGRFTVRVDGEEWTARAGERFTIPADAPHALRNDGSQPAEATVELRPALESAAFLRTTAGLARDGRTNEWGVPGPLQLAVLLEAYREEIYVAALPRSVQLGLAAMLAPLGRLLGLRPWYPRYEGDLASSAGAGSERR